MKEQIYTIPLNDALNSEPLCPLCAIYEKEEKNLLEYTLGPSMMEPDSREESNKNGFCSNHLEKMLQSEGNKLSMALMLSTHFDTVIKDVVSLSKKTPHPITSPLKKKDAGVNTNLIEKHLTSCVVCKKIEYTMTRYKEVLLYLYDTETDFRKKILSSRGFCQKHLFELITLAPHKLSNESCKNLVSSLLKLQAEKVQEDKEALLGFIDQFDYQKRSKDPSKYKNALSDTAKRLRG